MASLFNIGEADWRDLAKLLLFGATLAGAMAAAFVLIRQLRTHRDPVVEAWDELCTKLANCGVARAPHEGPIVLAQRVQEVRPHLAPLVLPLIQAYMELRYQEPLNSPPLTATWIRSVRRLKIA